MATFSDNFNSYANDSVLSGQGGWMDFGWTGEIKVLSDHVVGAESSAYAEAWYWLPLVDKDKANFEISYKLVTAPVGVNVSSILFCGQGFAFSSLSTFTGITWSGVSESIFALRNIPYSAGDVVSFKVTDGTHLELRVNGNLDNQYPEWPPYMVGSNGVFDMWVKVGLPFRAITLYTNDDVVRFDDLLVTYDANIYAGILYTRKGGQWVKRPLEIEQTTFKRKPVQVFSFYHWKPVQAT
jgi:hypothetical protein